VLVDTPPVGLLTDAQHVARICDGVLFVIGAGTTPLQLVQSSIAALGVERIVGTVLNRVQPQTAHENGYYHSYYQQASRAGD
jgi:Mrp family chromosome partitioning ATPase